MQVANAKAAARLAAVAVLAAACGRAEASSKEGVPGAAAASEPRVITVVAHDFAFQAPESVPAGMVTIQLQNRGQALHHLSLVRLEAGKTLQDVFTALEAKGPPPAWMREMGGPNVPDPGSDSNATLFLAPGNYVLLCWVDMPGGVPHVMRGMAKALTVTPAPGATAATTPTGDITMRLDDYSFTLSKPITAGKHTIRVENGAGQPHEVQLIKLAPGKTANDLMAWMRNMQGPPPASAIGGIAGMARGEVQSFTHDFTRGNYVLICFVPDAKDGKPHFMHGMMQTITVS